MENAKDTELKKHEKFIAPDGYEAVWVSSGSIGGDKIEVTRRYITNSAVLYLWITFQSGDNLFP